MVALLQAAGMVAWKHEELARRNRWAWKDYVREYWKSKQLKVCRGKTGPLR
jgi:hypothetical protein